MPHAGDADRLISGRRVVRERLDPPRAPTDRPKMLGWQICRAVVSITGAVSLIGQARCHSKNQASQGKSTFQVVGPCLPRNAIGSVSTHLKQSVPGYALHSEKGGLGLRGGGGEAALRWALAHSSLAGRKCPEAAASTAQRSALTLASPLHPRELLHLTLAEEPCSSRTHGCCVALG